MSEKPPSSRRCAFCGYDTKGVAAQGRYPCPECGTEFDTTLGPFLSQPRPLSSHLIAVFLPAVLAGGALCVEVTGIAGCLGASIRASDQFALFICGFVILATLAIGFRHSLRAAVAIRNAYVPGRVAERCWWYVPAVVSAYFLACGATVLVGIGALVLLFRR